MVVVLGGEVERDGKMGGEVGGGEMCGGKGGGGTARPLRVEENLGLGIIQSRQGQVQPASPIRRQEGGSGPEYGMARGREDEDMGGGRGVFMTSSCRLISG